jgi:serine/threonine protein kinase
LDNTKVFIKTDFVFNLLINEDTAFRIFSNDSYLKDKIIDVVLFSSDDRFIIMRYVDSQNILGFLDENPSESMNIIISMIEIVEALHNLNIVHRDIKMDNFIVVDKKLLLIDFLFCIDAHGQNRFRELTLNVRNSKNVLKHMNYSGKPDDYIWDDAYSLLQIYKIISKKHHIEKKIKSKIEKSIGKKQYILHQ